MIANIRFGGIVHTARLQTGSCVMDISDADVSRIIKDGFERGAQELGAASAADRRRLKGVGAGVWG